MKKAIVLLATALFLTSCAAVEIREGVSGIDTTPHYTGDCAKDHFDDYRNCLAMQTGGPDAGNE